MRWILNRVLRLFRRVQGTPAEPLRNALLRTTGLVCEAWFRVERRIRDRPLHPVSRLLLLDAADPFQRWDLSDPKRFRREFQELLAYLPERVDATVTEETFETVVGPVPLRRFDPGRPVQGRILFLHGGGFVLGGVASNDPECSFLARRTGCEVVSVGYPLAPEHTFPDAVRAVDGVVAHFATTGDLPLLLAGESAGANLAVGAVQRLDPILRPRIVALAAVYPFLDLTLSGESASRLATGYFLTRRLLDYFVDLYVGVEQTAGGTMADTGADLVDPSASPLFGDLSVLPPTLAISAEYDPLVSDGERLVQGIRASGGRADHVVEPGTVHGFLQLRTVSVARDRALLRIAHHLRRSLLRY